MTRQALRAPLQARSQATLGRLCNATIRLLESRNWPDLTVAEIVGEARSSVGSFYARFADKEALLDHLDELYTLDVIEFAAHLSDEIRRDDLDLDIAAHQLIEALVAFHRRQVGLLRALVLRARMYREPSYNERTTRMNRTFAELVELVSERLPPELGNHRHRRAFFGFSFAFSALRDRILFPESIHAPRPIPDDELADELSRNLLAYLGAPSPLNP